MCLVLLYGGFLPATLFALLLQFVHIGLSGFHLLLDDLHLSAFGLDLLLGNGLPVVEDLILSDSD